MFEEDFRSRITGDAGVAAAVAAASVAWGDRPQASALPAVTLDIIADPRPQHMAGFQGLRGTTVQCDIWSLDRQEARNVRELVIAAIAARATIGTTRFERSFITHGSSTFEQTDAKTIIYRERIDVEVWHADTN